MPVSIQEGFEGFKAMTDAVGGVDVDVEEPSKDDGYDFNVGTMHMTGDMAMAGARRRRIAARVVLCFIALLVVAAAAGCDGSTVNTART